MSPPVPSNQPLLPRQASTEGDAALHRPLAVSGLPSLAVADLPTSSPPALSSPPTLSSLLQALRRRWLTAFGLAILGAAAAVALVLTLVPASYVASARVHVHSRPERHPLVPAGEETDFPIVKANMAALVKSPAVLEAVVKQDKIRDLSMIRTQDNPVEWLEANIKTEYLIRLSPEILSISLAGDKAHEVALIVEAVTAALFEESRKQDRDRRKLLLDQMSTTERETKEKLFQLRAKLRSREAALGLEDPQTSLSNYQRAQGELSVAKKYAFENHLDQVRAQEEIKAGGDKLKNLDKWPVPEAILEAVLKLDVRSQTVEQELAKVEKDIQQIRRVSPRDSLDNLLRPKIKERQALLRQMEDLRVSLRPELEKKIREEEQARLTQLLQVAQEKLTSLKRTFETINTEVQRLEEEVRKLSPANRIQPADVEALKDEVERTDRALTKLSDTIHLLKVEPVRNSRLTLRQEKVLEPTSRDHSRQVKASAAAGAGMFGLLLLGVCWWEFQSRRISTAADVEHGLGMQVVGTLPHLPLKARRRGSGPPPPKMQFWQNQLCEAVDNIRTLLLHAVRTDNLRIVMVTSAEGGEGKTSLAGQLASSLARAWRKTLLVDGDLRNPAGHKLFDLPPEPGLCEVLRGEVNLNDAIRPTPVSRLWLLPAGHWDNHAAEALAQDSVHNLFELLKKQYDFIVVDSCPVLPVADSLLLGQHVDGVIFAILRDISRAPSVFAAQQRLQNLGIRTLGAVVIGTPSNSGNQAYKYLAR